MAQHILDTKVRDQLTIRARLIGVIDRFHDYICDNIFSPTDTFESLNDTTSNFNDLEDGWPPS